MAMSAQSLDPNAESLLQRARALAPALSERAKSTARLRRLPDETIADLASAGFFRILQPKRFGGYELTPMTLFHVQMILAEACPSTAWVLGVVAVHNWQLALFDLRAQLDVWEANSDARISSSYAPTGKIEAVDGGYRVSGRWSFSSGCDHCDWIFLGGFVPTSGPRPDMRTFLLPRADYRIDDNWHVIGLAGTGSKDIVVDGAFVPEHRTHRMNDGFKCASPGNRVHDAALYRLPFGQVFVRSVSTTAIGAARGALRVYCKTAQSRVAAGDGGKVAENPNAQMVAASAAALIDEAEVILRRNMQTLMDHAQAGEPTPLHTRVAFRFDSSNAVVKCVAAVDLLFCESGGRAIFLDHPLLGYFLDIHAARGHFANSPNKPGWNFGGLQLGLPNQDFFL
jgi:3-hydroxy-9,10-secoandrosta-1,3,5(10)-triene-9,17-dione monooxygenase